MNLSRHLHDLPWFRQAVLLVVGALGLLLTLWVDQTLSEGERVRLEQRFQMAAEKHLDSVASQIHRPLEELVSLQYLFSSIEQVDWPTFKRFSRLMLDRHGIQSIAWYPRVTAERRMRFEQEGRKLWGRGFSVNEPDNEGRRLRAGERVQYFPLLYGCPEETARTTAGDDAYASAVHAPLIDRAVSTGQAVASESGLPGVDPARSDRLVVFLPVYRDASVPDSHATRQEKLAGIVSATLSLRGLLAAASSETDDGRFRLSLLDLKPQTDKQAAVVWDNRAAGEAGANPQAPVYDKEIELAGQRWSLRVTAAQSWLDSNQLHELRLVWPLGILTTLLLLISLHSLLRRSMVANILESSRNDDLVQRQATEDWAKKLFMAVEQNPATVFIADLAGRFEYVNDKFIETTGYRKEEVIGQPTSMLRPASVDAAPYAAMWERVRGGNSWQGELQTQRRDGSLFWERVLMSPLKGSDGKVTSFVAIQEDITELRHIMNRLKKSESRFRAVMAVMVEGLAVIEADGRFVFSNRAADEFMGCIENGLQGRRIEDIGIEHLHSNGLPCPPEEYPSSYTLREGRQVKDAVIGFRKDDGTVRWMEVNTQPLHSSKKDRWGVVMTLSDITERRLAEEQLKLAFEAIRCSGEGILVTDDAHRIISVNPAFEKATGYSAVELIGKVPISVASGRHDERFFSEMQDAIRATGHWQGEVWNQRKNGDVFPEWLGVSVVNEQDGRSKYYVYIYSDMTEHKESQRRIELLANHDPLTGLPNRLLLRDRVEQAQAQANRMHSRVALMFLDLDRFKTINDSLGHPVGDELLKEVVTRLKACVRDSDTISRQGGDEFIILLNDVRDSDAVSRVAEKIHQRMTEPMKVQQHLLTTSFSIGVAIYPDDGQDFDMLLQKADTAMYHAKEAGRNGHRFFTEQMNLMVVEHLTLETQLRRALENREFVLHYQPQIDLQEGTIIGVEALIRWNSPDNGLVSPARFIPVAEDSGLIVPIGDWVLGEACRQASEWQEAGLPPFVMAVNLSGVQFKRQDLINSVINALVLSNLDSQWLELELTESILIQDAEATLDTVRRLKALGVKLSVDDFGTGYSSLTYLKRFDVDKLKIDQSFVRDLVSDPEDAAIVRAIIQMAHSLKLKTIAEGVENEEVANLLRVFHCDEIQGYWMARPMPANELVNFVRAHRTGDMRWMQGSLL